MIQYSVQFYLSTRLRRRLCASQRITSKCFDISISRLEHWKIGKELYDPKQLSCLFFLASAGVCTLTTIIQRTDHRGSIATSHY